MRSPENLPAPAGLSGPSADKDGVAERKSYERRRSRDYDAGSQQPEPPFIPGEPNSPVLGDFSAEKSSYSCRQTRRNSRRVSGEFEVRTLDAPLPYAADGNSESFNPQRPMSAPSAGLVQKAQELLRAMQEEAQVVTGPAGDVLRASMPMVALVASEAALRGTLPSADAHGGGHRGHRGSDTLMGLSQDDSHLMGFDHDRRRDSAVGAGRAARASALQLKPQNAFMTELVSRDRQSSSSRNSSVEPKGRNSCRMSSGEQPRGRNSRSSEGSPKMLARTLNATVKFLEAPMRSDSRSRMAKLNASTTHVPATEPAGAAYGPADRRISWPNRPRRRSSMGNIAAAARERRSSLVARFAEMRHSNLGRPTTCGDTVLRGLSVLVRAAALCAIAFNSILFPFELAFSGDVCFGEKPAWASVTLASDVVLWLQLLVTGHSAYQAKVQELNSSPLVPSSPTATKLKALRSSAWWVLALLPYDWIIDGDAHCFRFGHLPRALLLVQLLAFFSSCVNARFPALGPGRAAARLVQLFVTAILILHWYACLQYVVAMRLVSGSGAFITWALEDDLGVRPVWARYLRSFDRGLLVVMGEGVHGKTDEEIAVSLIGLLAGTGLVAFGTSLIVQEVTSTYNREGRTREKIGRVESYLRSAQLPKELRQRCLHHMKHVLLARQLTVDTEELLVDLSQPLREEVALHCCQKLVVNLLHVLDLGQQVDLLLIKSLVSQLKLKIFSPGDELFVEGEEGLEVYFIESGLVIVELSNGTELARRTTGACVGEIALLTGEPRLATCRALTFCETYALSRSSFATVLENHKDLAQRVGQMARQRSLETLRARNKIRETEGDKTGTPLERQQTRSNMMPSWLTDPEKQSRIKDGDRDEKRDRFSRAVSHHSEEARKLEDAAHRASVVGFAADEERTSFGSFTKRVGAGAVDGGGSSPLDGRSIFRTRLRSTSSPTETETPPQTGGGARASSPAPLGRAPPAARPPKLARGPSAGSGRCLMVSPVAERREAFDDKAERKHSTIDDLLDAAPGEERASTSAAKPGRSVLSRGIEGITTSFSGMFSSGSAGGPPRERRGSNETRVEAERKDSLALLSA